MDVVLNIGTSLLLAVAVFVAAKAVEQEAAASCLLLFSFSSIGGWLLIFGSNARLVMFANNIAKLGNGVVASLMLSLVTSLPLAVLSLIVQRPIAGFPALWTVVTSFIIALSLVGREIGNLVYGRIVNAAVGLALGVAGLLVFLAAMHFKLMSPQSAFLIFLFVYYGAGMPFVGMFTVFRLNKFEMFEVNLFIRETLKTNFALALATLSIGNFDKLILSLRPALSGIQVSYVFADRFASIYTITTNYLTQSQIQRRISGQEFSSSTPVIAIIFKWVKLNLGLLFVFSAISIFLGIAMAENLKLPVSDFYMAIFIAIISITAFIKNSIGFSIRLNDMRGHSNWFNKFALLTIVISLIVGLLLDPDSITLIILAKLALHLGLFVLIVWASHKAPA